MAIEKDNQIKMPKEILPEEVELQAQDINPSDSDVDIQMMEDGGAMWLTLTHKRALWKVRCIHTANLAEFLDDNDLNEIASEVLESYEECASSRDEWEQTYKKGLDLLGFKYEDRVRTISRCIWCNTPCSCRSSNTVSSVGLQRTYAIKWSC